MKYKIYDLKEDGSFFVIEANDDYEFLDNVYRRTRYQWFGDNMHEMLQKLWKGEGMPIECTVNWASFKRWFLESGRGEEFADKQETTQ
tara:strand:+ start:256 stop:519 length:264 start_codon:yes stop_codon:yes gene_type:complete